jgi:hypothetical protein
MQLSKEITFLININQINIYLWKNRCLSQYIAKCKHTQKMIQIIAKFYEVHSHILNMNNCTIPIIIERFDLCDFTKKSKQVFHLNEHKCVEKKHFVKKLFSFEDDKNYVRGFYIKIQFICLSKC